MSFKLMVIILIGVLNLSMRSSSIEAENMLTNDDFFLRQVSNEGGAPSSYWKSDGELIPSFNEWRCFSTQASTVTCSLHEMDEPIHTPMLALYDGDETLEVETSSVDDIDCESTKAEWNRLLEGEEVVCTLAAFLQDLPHENYGGSKRRTLWIVEALKTSKGYWLNPTLLEKIEMTTDH